MTTLVVLTLIVISIWLLFRPRRTPYIKAWYQEYLHSAAWHEKRLLKLREAGFRCQLCNSASPLQVHHRHYRDIGHENTRDLIVLCSRCHQHFHDK